MYKWLYVQIYYYLHRRKNLDPVYNSTVCISLVITVHLALIALIASKLFSFKIFRFYKESGYNSLAMMPFVILFLFLSYFYYKARHKSITEKYRSVLQPLKFYIIMSVVTLLPLYIAIKLSGGEIWRFK
jgi:hypothetical protein